MTEPHDWDLLMNRRVTVTNPDNPEGTWTGELTGLFNEPVLMLELDDGTERPLPQRFTVTLAGPEPESGPGNDDDDDELTADSFLVIRAKWGIDGATSLEDAAARAEEFAAHLRGLAAEAHSITEVSPHLVTVLFLGRQRQASNYWTPDGLQSIGMAVDQEAWA